VEKKRVRPPSTRRWREKVKERLARRKKGRPRFSVNVVKEMARRQSNPTRGEKETEIASKQVPWMIGGRARKAEKERASKGEERSAP